MRLDLRNKLAQPSNYKSLLTGHTGCGKSSELIRLGQLVATDFFVIWFDAEVSLSRPNHFDVILGMGVAAHQVAQQAGFRPNDKLTNKLLESLASFIRKYENRKGFTLKLEQVLKQVFAMVVGAGATAVAGPAGAAAAILGATQLELKVGDDLVRTLELPANRQALRTVLQNGSFSGGSSAEIEDVMIRDLSLLRYENNGISWFDAHPNALAQL